MMPLDLLYIFVYSLPINKKNHETIGTNTKSIGPHCYQAHIRRWKGALQKVNENCWFFESIVTKVCYLWNQRHLGSNVQVFLLLASEM